MSYYNETPEGPELDLAAAIAELGSNPRLANEGIRREVVARLTAAALLDIAASLRVLATESALAVGQAFELVGDSVPMMGGAPDLTPDAFVPDVVDALAGTRVRLKAPDSKGRHREGTLTGHDGVSEDVAWVGVHWDDAPSVDSDEKVYAVNLEVVTVEGNDRDRANEAPDVPPVSDAPELDEIDDDFAAAGDDERDRREVEEREPADALEALKAKTKKSKGKK